MPEKNTPTSTTAPIHFGVLFENYLIQHRTYKAALARVIGKAAVMIGRYRAAPSLQSSIIESLSHALKHNFFADMAAQLPADYTVAAAPDTTKDEEIATLKQQVLILQAEKELLMEITRKP